MNDNFVQTKNVMRFRDAVDAARAKRGPKLVFVKGRVGLGKTRTCAWHAAQNGALYMEAQPGWTIGWFLDDLCFEMGIVPSHKLSGRSRQVKEVLARDKVDLIIDESDRLRHDRKLLETIQSIHDFCKIPVVLVGMGEIEESLRTYPQLCSRIYRKVEFNEFTKDEARDIIRQLTDVEVPDEILSDDAAKVLNTMRAIEHFIPDIEKAVRSRGGGKAAPEMVDNIIKRRVTRLIA